MIVSRTQDRLVYKVASGSDPDLPRTVDLEANIGHNGVPAGECDCEDWTWTCHPNWLKNGNKIVPYWKKGQKEGNPNRTSCYHIEAARQKFTNDMLKQLIQPFVQHGNIS